MLLDKLSIINDALIATGNEPVTTDDGSAQWIAASTAYSRMLPIVLYKHNWVFQTNLVNLPRLGASTYPGYSDIYEKPQDCLHILNVWPSDRVSFSTTPPELDYKIIGNHIHCSSPGGVVALYEIDPSFHNEIVLDVTPGILETLRREIEALLYQGLNEDTPSAKLAKGLADLELSFARSRADQEAPRRVAFRAAFTEKRRRSHLGSWR